MPRRFGALAILFLVVAISLPLAGLAFGAWTTDLKITGTITVEDTGLPPGVAPSGVEVVQVGLDDALGAFVLEECHPAPDAWAETRLVDSNGDGSKDTVEFTLTRGYSSYIGRVLVVLENRGDECVQVDSFNLIYPEHPDGRFDLVGVKAVPSDWSHPPGIGVWFAPVDMPISVEAGKKAFIEGFVRISQEAENGEHGFAISWNAS